jgi:hypothetical protein
MSPLGVAVPEMRPASVFTTFKSSVGDLIEKTFVTKETTLKSPKEAVIVFTVKF